jgi:uroporphyrinogen-III synthase
LNPRPLEGLGVVITRPAEAADTLARELAAAGAKPFVFPALHLEALGDHPDLATALAALPQTDLAIFVSANAVAFGLAAVRRAGLAWPPGTAVAGVGEATAQALRNSGFASVISPPERFDSEGLLACAPLQAVGGRNIIVFRGLEGREKLRDALVARGANVLYAPCYRRSRPGTDPAPLLAAWKRGEVHAVGVLS